MSSPVDSSRAWEDEFKARYGAAPASPPSSTDLQRYAEMCQELLQERAALQAELARARQERAQLLKAVSACMAKEFPRLEVDYETLRAQAVETPTLQELIAELQREEAT